VSLLQKYKLATLKLDSLPHWDGDWGSVHDGQRIQLVASRWLLHQQMTWSEQSEVEAWERARKVATS